MEEAAYWYGKAANKGNTTAITAICKVAICYENGEGVVKDTFKAVDLLCQVAELRHAAEQVRAAAKTKFIELVSSLLRLAQDDEWAEANGGRLEWLRHGQKGHKDATNVRCRLVS
eukprot:54358-Eustigmatos_ZCMA.PRE.1